MVEYSGYDPAKPGRNLLEDNADAIAELGLDGDDLCTTLAFLCNAPAQPSSIIAVAMGYAVVAVNVRGTGCSGGAYDYFEPLQVLDGYDVIETVAAQDWVYNHKVGMVGLSYPGIASCSWPGHNRRAWPRSLRCRSWTTPCAGCSPRRHLQRGLRAHVGRRGAEEGRALRTGLGAGAGRRGRHHL